ncbi:MAG TPA: endonuclease III [Thermodesulfovibrionales bacterium]|nr:endonuclease III [Thermodesulfovibrionales bacterium]
MDAKEKILEIIRRLRKEYPEPGTVLSFKNPFELLVATILSAQTTDVHVNRVTELLFGKYRSIKDYAEASPDELKKDLSSINFYNNKARHIQASARAIMENFGSQVPKTMDELTRLPGVARKTANIILFDAYGINEGIAVDTHVRRVSARLGLTQNEDPVKIEKDLMAMTPKREWGYLSHLLIFHGRKVCKARRPVHADCVLFNICPSRHI